MISGVGVDIVEISRIKDSIAHKVLSEEEIIVWNSFQSVDRKREYLAGRFAIKEAIKKALLEYEGFSGMNELVVMNDELGRPILKFPIYKDKIINLSLSHEREYAIGFCVIEKIDL